MSRRKVLCSLFKKNTKMFNEIQMFFSFVKHVSVVKCLVV